MLVPSVCKLCVTVTKLGLRLGKSFRAFCTIKAVAPKLIQANNNNYNIYFLLVKLKEQ